MDLDNSGDDIYTKNTCPNQTEALGGGLPALVGTSHSARPLRQGDGQRPIEEGFED